LYFVTKLSVSVPAFSCAATYEGHVDQWCSDYSFCTVGRRILLLMTISCVLASLGAHPGILRGLSFHTRRETGSVVFEKRPLVEPTMFRALGRGAGTIQGKVSVAGQPVFASVLGLTIPPQAEVCMKRLKSRARLQFSSR
jgi:hypothetical protein